MGSDDFQQFLDEFESKNNFQNPNLSDKIIGDKRPSILDTSNLVELNMSTSFGDYRNSTIDDASFLIRRGKENTSNHIPPEIFLA